MYPSILLLNARSLVPKLDELNLLSSSTNVNVMIVTESWLSSNILNEQIVIPGFGAPFRCDRSDGRVGGGVCVYVNDCISCDPIVEINPPILPCERLFIRFVKLKVLLLAIYIPPNLKKKDHESIFEHMSSFIESSLLRDDCERLIIAGDLNDFPTENLEIQFSLKQTVTSPTRGDSILDKILLSHDLLDYYNDPTVEANLANCDHQTIFLLPTTTQPKLTRVKRVYDYRESNIAQFLQHINSYSWSDFYRSELSISDKCNIVYDRVNEALDKIPCESVKMSGRDKPWITPKLKLLINKRFAAYRTKNWPLFQHLKAKIKQEIMKAKRTWLEKSATKSSGFWKSVNEIRNKSHDNSLVSLLLKFPSLYVAVEKINVSFCKYFSASPDWNVIHQEIEKSTMDDACASWNPIISVQEVFTELRNINVRKAAGSDRLPPRLLRAGADVFAPILAHLINLSAETKSVPLQWKIANVVPIPKKRNPTIEELRPISLLPIFAKICEKLILASVKKQLIELYGPHQFGFRPRSSTTLSHIKLHNFITEQLDLPAVASVLLISFDMSRAFDSLSHGALMRTLIHSGLPMGFISWCSSYLQNRQQKVIIEQMTSTSMNVTSGVPQGSIIAPFLFCVQMRSAKPFSPEALILKYAGDIFIAIPVLKSAVTSTSISTLIQTESDHMKKWCLENGLKLNPNKTKSLLISKKGKGSLGYTTETLSAELKFLGLTYNTELNWKSHVSLITKTASRMTYVLRKLKTFLPKPLLIQVYRAIIRSRLEYGNAAFVGLSIGEKEKLEKIQRLCHRLICGPLCSCSEFPSLDSRRIKNAMYIFTQMQHEDHMLHDMYPPVLPHGKRLFLPFSKTNRRLNSFLPFCTCYFNHLV